jgi:hypothetical protein
LPAHEWAAVGEAKDGAEALAFAKDVKDALFARQQYGFGRVLYLGLDSTWRWRFKSGDEHHNRFWKQVVQWAVADRMLPVANAAGTIRFGTREPFYETGRPVEVLLRAAESIPPLSAKAVAAVILTRLGEGKEEVLGIVSFEPNPSRPKELTAKVRDLAPGRYAIGPEIAEWSEHLRSAEGGPRKLRAVFEVIPPESNEMADLSANIPLIEELAQASGGRVFELSQVDELANLLASRTAEKELDVAIPLQRSWWTLGFVAALLALEWYIRKKSGLA